MSIGTRIQARLTELNMTRAELARRVGLDQATIHHLVRGRNRSSTQLHRIAEALGTTVGHLEGEIEDAGATAPAPPPVPVIQHLNQPVALPAEHALAAAFKALLTQAQPASEDDLAWALARGLPGVLRVPHHALWSAPARNAQKAAIDAQARRARSCRLEP